MKKAILILLSVMLAHAAWGKDINPADYPLSATVVSVQLFDNVEASQVHDTTGKLTGSVITGQRKWYFELRIVDIVYLAVANKNNLTVGSTVRARVDGKHIDVLGEKKVWRLDVIGQRLEK